ncbi:cobalt-precorrin-5B (C(1))-methyltransferase CbiD, partial [Desulfovibrio sp.]|uniref:cobalt-precorrin-5B (C(1))-methyltransferase CbiD n=1 Tax=Desulfovibrio sp. TaxID=885 RepID=UPI0023D34C57
RAPARAPTPLPPVPGGRPRAWLAVPVALCAPYPAPELAGQPVPAGAPCAHARVRKDGGDDPDATTGALITASVFLRKDAAASGINLQGGPGVGRVTLPGLPVPVGAPAINPGPRAQMRLALENALAARCGDAPGPGALTVIISVPGGEELARQTLNPRLGIVGGISILGTQGTVRPYSHAAWRATVAQGLSVARATGCRTFCLSTGRRSEVLLMRRYPELPPQAFIQAADFARFSLAAAGELTPALLVWGCFFGKLAKLAQGLEYTHARESPLDMDALAALCAGAGARCAPAIGRCVTAAHALELLLDDPSGMAAIAAVGARAAATARHFAGRPVRIHLFHTDGRELLTL